MSFQNRQGDNATFWQCAFLSSSTYFCMHGGGCWQEMWYTWLLLWNPESAFYLQCLCLFLFLSNIIRNWIGDIGLFLLLLLLPRVSAYFAKAPARNPLLHVQWIRVCVFKDLSVGNRDKVWCPWELNIKWLGSRGALWTFPPGNWSTKWIQPKIILNYQNLIFYTVVIIYFVEVCYCACTREGKMYQIIFHSPWFHTLLPILISVKCLPLNWL